MSEHSIGLGDRRELPTLSLQGNPCLLDTSVASATTSVAAVACLSRLGRNSLTHVMLHVVSRRGISGEPPLSTLSQGHVSTQTRYMLLGGEVGLGEAAPYILVPRTLRCYSLRP